MASIKLGLLVEAIHRAVSEAADALMDRHGELLDRYFSKVEEASDSPGQGTKTVRLNPKTVEISYPSAEGQEQYNVQVPLITLVPITTPQIEKVVLTAEFNMSIENDQLMLDFSKPRRIGGNHVGKIEVTISPGETPEGLRQMIEGYETTLKRQIL